MDRTEYSLRLMSGGRSTRLGVDETNHAGAYATRRCGFSRSLCAVTLKAIAIVLASAFVLQSAFAICPVASYPEFAATDASIVVAPWGDDENEGSAEQPVQTLKRASYLAKPGEVVLLRGGIYPQRQIIGKGGQEGQPVTFAAWPSELPIVDGSEVIVEPHQGLLQINASDVVVDGIEVRNSTGRGVSVYDSDRVTLRRSHIHNIDTKGFTGSGDDLLVESNVFENLVMENVDGAGPRPWPAGIATWHRPKGKPISGFRLINNDISRVWGECVGLVFTENAQVTGNRVRDCYSVGVYLDNTRDTSVQRNTISSTSDEFNRIDNDRAMVAINLAVENYDSASPMMARGITVANNIIRGVDRGIGFFNDPASKSEQNSYSDVLLAYNAICDTRHAAVHFSASPGIPPAGNRMLNNVLCAGESSSDPVFVEQADGWMIDHNAYPDGAADLAGRGHLRDRFKVGDGGGNVSNEWQIDTDSPLVGQALAIADVMDDVACTPRDAAGPSIGPREP